MTRIGVQTIFGAQREPFLESSLRSVAWADYVRAINTAPDSEYGRENEATIRRVVPPEKLRLEHVQMDPIDFAAARNAALALVEDGDYVLIVDCDEVFYPEFEATARHWIEFGYDAITSHYYHLASFKNLLHSERHREILYQKTSEVCWEGGVHERLVHPRKNPVVAEGFHGVHCGYIKPAREVAARWELYRSLGAEIHDYDVSQPDRALDDWPRICRPFLGEHPPAVRELLKSYPEAPADIFPKRHGKPRVGLVLLTWDDEENLRGCLRSLALTQEPFELCVVDNGSLDGTLGLIEDFARETGTPTEVMTVPADGEAIVRESLAVALNRGFGYFMDREDLPYVGWIHPDHSFGWTDWLGELCRGLDEHPEYVKLGASEAGNQFPDPRPGNSQCFLMRRAAWKQVGGYDPLMEGCGGAEDWLANHFLLQIGQVMIWPTSVVRHKAMETRKRHDNVEAAKRNMDRYHAITGTWDPPV